MNTTSSALQIVATPAAPPGTASASASFGARAQALVAAAQARHTEGAAYVKANAAKLKAGVTPELLAAMKDPVLVEVLQAKLAKAIADAATIDARLNASLAVFANQSAQIKAQTGV